MSRQPDIGRKLGTAHAMQTIYPEPAPSSVETAGAPGIPRTVCVVKLSFTEYQMTIEVLERAAVSAREVGEIRSYLSIIDKIRGAQREAGFD